MMSHEFLFLLNKYLGENFYQCTRELDLSREEVITLCQNSITSSFLPQTKKEQYLKKLSEVL